MKSIGALAPPYRIAAIGTVCIAAFVLWGLLQALLAAGVPIDLATKDFANYWMAARLVDSGQTADLFGPQPIYFAHLQAAFGDSYPWHNWSYPPHFLLLIWPLGLLGYKTAAVTFLLVTGGLFLWALSIFAGRLSLMVMIAAGPFIVHTLAVVQNGFLTAGLGLGALGLREKRPVLAGILLGLLTVKPQIGILFPFLLLAERRWTMLASAAATTIGLIAASAAIFGVDAWEGYLREVLPYQAVVMRDMQGSFLAMMPTVYGMLRNWGVTADLALPMHVAVGLPVAVISIAAFLRIEDSRSRAIVLLVATFIVTPYILSYDLGLLAAALAVMAGSGVERHGAVRGQTILLALAMLLPILLTPLGGVDLSLAPAVLVAVFALALRQAEFSMTPRPESSVRQP